MSSSFNRPASSRYIGRPMLSKNKHGLAKKQRQVLSTGTFIDLSYRSRSCIEYSLTHLYSFFFPSYL